MVHNSRWMVVAAASLGFLLGPFAGVAQANGHIIETVDCEGLGTIDISTQNTHSDLNWGAVQIVDASGHLIPVSFTFSLEDLTTDMVLFSESAAKGSGHASSQQSTATCSQTFTSTLAEFWDPAEPLPPGASLDDVVRFTLSAQVVVKP